MGRFDKKDNLIGQSNAFLAVLDQVSLVAQLDKPILIIGERGTGKELVAARIHFLSQRWQQNYLTVNCAALNDNLLESELFGHEAGSFTGAGSKRHLGRFERSHQGSLFLDELANTSMLVQEKLLRVIEYGEFERLGGSQTIKVDTRLICATNEDLPSLSKNNQFRADLLDRLAFDVITLPPLRYRPEDILLLAEHFAISMVKQLGWEFFSGFSAAAEQQLLEYSWPGNIRELKNAIERSVYRTQSPQVVVSDIILDPFDSPFRPTQQQRTNTVSSTVEHKDIQTEITKVRYPIDFKQQSAEYEMKLLRQALAESQFNQKKTAEILQLTYHQLRGYLKKYQLLDLKSYDE